MDHLLPATGQREAEIVRPRPESSHAPELIGVVGVANSVQITEKQKQGNLVEGFTTLPNGNSFLVLSGASYVNSAVRETGGIETDIDPKFFRLHEHENFPGKTSVSLPVTALDELSAGEYFIKGSLFGSQQEKGAVRAVISLEEDVDRLRRFRVTKTAEAATLSQQEVDAGVLGAAVNDYEDLNMEGTPGYNALRFVQHLDSSNREFTYLSKISSTRLLQTVGFEVDRGGKFPEITAVPTPLTLKELAARQGVDVRLIDERNDRGAIPAIKYVQAFADRAYPVGTAGFNYYSHDIGEGHFTAVLAIPEIMNFLQPLAAKSMQAGECKYVDDFAASIDLLTNAAWELYVHIETPLRVNEQLALCEATAQKLVESVGLEYEPGTFRKFIAGGFLRSGRAEGWPASKCEAALATLTKS